MSNGASYIISLLDPDDGSLKAVIQEYRTLQFEKRVNGIGMYRIVLCANDPNVQHFTLDTIVQISRILPGQTAGEIVYVGLHRTDHEQNKSDGDFEFTAIGVSLNELLNRRIIAYLGGSTGASKSMAADTAAYQYALENIGANATTANGRIQNGASDGVIGNFVTNAPAGSAGAFEGDRAYLNLLKVMQDLADYSAQANVLLANPGSEPFDFEVSYGVGHTYELSFYPGQLGADRTLGNPGGNSPVIFSRQFGNMSNGRYGYDRDTEVNAVYALGPGKQAARLVATEENAQFVADSPINRREAAKNGRNQQTVAQLSGVALQWLYKLQPEEDLNFTPLQTSFKWRQHYKLGDRVTAVHERASGEITMEKRIVAIDVLSNGSDPERIRVEFADLPSKRNLNGPDRVFQQIARNLQVINDEVRGLQANESA